jgi:hypothetical protein
VSGHAEVILHRLRADGTSPAVPHFDAADILTFAAAQCVEPLDVWHLTRPYDAQCGVWSYERGQRIPGTNDVFALARCSRCGMCRDAVLKATGGPPLGGRPFRPMGDPG